MSKYPRLRNGKLEGGGLFRPHIFLEEKKEIWVLCESSITAMGIDEYKVLSRLQELFSQEQNCK